METSEGSQFRGRLFRKYAAFFVAVVCVALISFGALDTWFYYREYRDLVVRLERAQAELTAAKIVQRFDDIEGQIGWTTMQRWKASTVEEWRFDLVRLLRQVPAIAEFAKLDENGREQLRASRTAPDRIGSGVDHSQEPQFREALARRKYYGPVYFDRGSEPRMTLALAGLDRDFGVSVAEIDLKFISDIVAKTKVGEHGQAYIVDATGRLIAHPDMSLVLRNTDLSQSAQVQAARAAAAAGPPQQEQVAVDLKGRNVLVAFAPIAALGWWTFIELPVAEGYAFLYWSLLRSALHLTAALVLAVLAGLLLARRMVGPVRALQRGAARIGGGDLGQRLAISTNDELEALGLEFNRMATQLQESYASLERKVDERTHALTLANLAKSRFLAAASHDLRQPLHALGLFVAELGTKRQSRDGRRLVKQIAAALAAMNSLFDALLDISRLDAGTLTPEPSDFPIQKLLDRMESTFAAAARQKDLTLRVVASTVFVRSDEILLERILTNLVGNAVRYTAQGGVVVGCRRSGARVEIEVCDSGPGIPEDQQRNIFGEFYQLAGGSRDGGLGLGLAIVERLCGLLEHPIRLRSRLGKGSCFAVSVPLAARTVAAAQPLPARTSRSPAGKVVVVIDDDAIVLDAMSGLMRSWGCRVVSAEGADGALALLSAHGIGPDLIISDCRLRNGMTGIEAIGRIRRALAREIPAFLVSGDTGPDQLRDAQASRYHLLHKPVPAMALRAMLNELLREPDAVT